MKKKLLALLVGITITSSKRLPLKHTKVANSDSFTAFSHQLITRGPRGRCLKSKNTRFLFSQGEILFL